MTRFFSSRSIETLIDLVEIKLSCLDVMDREDREELKVLKRSLSELQSYQKVVIAPNGRVSEPNCMTPP